MRNGKLTKEKIILEAFKLFAVKSYEKVTFIDIEKATGLSRGAILYHYKSKESIFLAVIEKYIFERASIDQIYYKNPQISLSSFISAFIDLCKKEKKEMISLGVNNMNSAILNIELNAFLAFPDLLQTAYERQCKEAKVIKKVIENAVKTKEIRDDFNIDTLLHLFITSFLGTSYEGVAYPKGYKLDALNKDFRMLYNFVKSK